MDKKEPKDSGSSGLNKEEKLELLEKCSEDIKMFAETFFPHLLSSESAEFHDVIYRELPVRDFSCVQVFRGGAKSTIGLIIYPIWFAIYMRIGNISLISMSERFILNEIMRIIKKEFESNIMLREIFGDLTTQKWSESFFVLKNGISFEGCGISGQLRGGRKGLIVLDDLEDEESSSSEEQRDKLRKRINKELIPKLVKNGQMIYFGTPIHNLCFIKQLFDTPKNGWFKLKFPAYKNGEIRAGNEAWPSLFPHERLERIKNTMGSNEFACEYLCEPVAEGSQPIKPEQIKYWETLPEQRSSVISLDPAYSEDAGADWKVASMVSIDSLQNRYLCSYIRTHAQLGEYIDSVINLWLLHKHEVQAIGIPNSGVEKSFFESFNKRCTERKVYPPIMELKNTYTGTSGVSVRNKKSRIIAALQGLFEHGKYYIHSNHQEARDELLSVGTSRWDDVVDSMAGAEQLLQNAYVPITNEQQFSGYENTQLTGTTGYGI